MSYYNKTLQLMQINKRINELKAKLYSLDGVSVSQNGGTRRSHNKGDTIGGIVVKREELQNEIAALEEERKTFLSDVKKALNACCNYNIWGSVEALRHVDHVIVDNYTVSYMSSLSGKPPAKINELIKTYLKRMKEREEKGTLKISTW